MKELKNEGLEMTCPLEGGETGITCCIDMSILLHQG